MIEEAIIIYSIVAIIGLIIGSFINVAVYRLPIMLQYVDKNEDELTLFFPKSHCTNCKNSIRKIHNIPILGYILLKGQCFHCKSSISMIYPLVEALTCLLFLIIAVKYGVSLKAVGLMIFATFLMILSLIDFKYFILPDQLTLPLLWLGLVVNTSELYTDTSSAILGAVFGYLILYLVFYIYKIIRKKEALGYGDFKLLAAIGAWGGWQILPLVILVASITGIIFGIWNMIQGKGQKIAFGPFLSIGGFILLFI